MAARADEHSRIALFHGAILCASIAAAVMAYTRPQWVQRPSETTVVAPIPAGPLSLTFAEQGTCVTVARTADGHVDVTVTETAEGGPAPRPARYHGNEVAQHLIRDLLPLQARRTLGMLDQTHVARFGLAPAEATLTVEAAGHKMVVALGHTLYGSGDVYARVEGRGSYVLPGGLFRNFERAGFALWDRRFLGTTPDAIGKYELIHGNQRCVFLREVGAQKDTYYVRAERPDQRDDTAQVFITQLAQLQFTQAASPSGPDELQGLAVIWYSNDPEPSQCGTARLAPPSENVLGRSDALYAPVHIPRTDAENLWRMAQQICLN